MPPSNSTPDTLIRGRTKRSNAGNRMRELLDQEIEVEEVFQEVEDDIDFQEKQDEEDVVDSDFGKSSDEEGDQGQGDSEEEGERQLQAEERAKRKASQRKAAVAPHLRKPAIRVLSQPDGSLRAPPKRASFARSALVASSTSASRSFRRSTQATTASTHAKLLADSQRRAAKTPRVRRPKRAKLTQDALIAEALETEERNRASLRVFLDREEERRARDRRGGKKEIEGPILRWHSAGVEMGTDKAGARRGREMTEVSLAGTPTPGGLGGADLIADPVMVDRIAAAQLRSGEASNEVSRAQGLVSSSFASPTPDQGNANPRQSRTLLSLRNLPPSTTWPDEFRLVLGTHCAWEAVPSVAARNRPLRPRQSTCAITGAPAIYRDPRNGVPFASAEAYTVLTEVMQQKFAWSTDSAPATSSSVVARGGAQPDEATEPWRIGVYTDRIDETGANGVLEEARQKAGPPPLPRSTTAGTSRRPVAPSVTVPSRAVHPSTNANAIAASAAPTPSTQTQTHAHAHGWVIAPALEVAPGDEKAIVAAALALPSGTTRSGGRRSAAAAASGEAQ